MIGVGRGRIASSGLNTSIDTWDTIRREREVEIAEDIDSGWTGMAAALAT